MPNVGLPWLRSHGPIEAGLCGAGAGRCTRSFRGYEATAPLKLIERYAPLHNLSPSVATKPRPH